MYKLFKVLIFMRNVYAHTSHHCYTILIATYILPSKDWVFNTSHILQGSEKADKRIEEFFLPRCIKMTLMHSPCMWQSQSPDIFLSLRYFSMEFRFQNKLTIPANPSPSYTYEPSTCPKKNTVIENDLILCANNIILDLLIVSHLKN